MKRCWIVLLMLCASPVFAQNSFLAPGGTGGGGIKCGVERWPVKTLADNPKFGPAIPTSVSELIGLKAPNETVLKRAESKRFPSETYLYAVDALIMGFKLESDGDFHIVIANPTNESQTMIAEIPSGDCVPANFKEKFDGLQVRFEKEFGKPIKRFRHLPQPVHVKITGVFFFDFLHGQTGVAPNGAELHPVLDWTKQ